MEVIGEVEESETYLTLLNVQEGKNLGQFRLRFQFSEIKMG